METPPVEQQERDGGVAFGLGGFGQFVVTTEASGALLYEAPVPPPEFAYEAAGQAEYAIGQELPGLDSWLADAYYEVEAQRAALPGRTAERLLTVVPAEPEWLVPSVLAPRWVIDVAARERCGKGKLISLCIVAPLERGEGSMFGPYEGAPLTTLIVTEESPESLREKLDDAAIRHARIIYGYELAHLGSWDAKVAELVRVAKLGGHGLVWVENISRAAGVDDESGVELARAAETFIDAVKAAGLTGIFDHHHKKGADALENKSRGGTALVGAVDVHIDMERDGDRGSRRRRLLARGKMAATTWERYCELSEDRRTYTLADAPQRRADAREDELLFDRIKLAQLGTATVKEFATALGMNPDASGDYKRAERRLQALVAEGDAVKDGRRGRAIVYAPVAISTEQLDSTVVENVEIEPGA